MQRIGTVLGVHRYPVKGFRGERLESVAVRPCGVELDRIYAFVDPGASPEFPWFTGRKRPEMILYTPVFAGTDERGRVAIDVVTPDGTSRRLTDPVFLGELRSRWGCDFELRYDVNGMHDAKPVSIFGRATLEQLERETGIALDPLRFRPNFFVDFEDREPFYEDSLVGSTVQIGECLRLRIDKKNSRCVMINLEPASADKAPQVLKTVGKSHGGLAGIYGTPLAEGAVTEGDPVYLV